MVLAYSGCEWDQKAYTPGDKESWGADKMGLGLEFPNLPYVRYEGHDWNLTESKAVTMFLCEKYAPQLLGKNLQEKAMIEMYMLKLTDSFMASIGKTFQSDDRAEC